jgi:MFS family permease
MQSMPEEGTDMDEELGRRTASGLFAVVLALLMAAGWAANHFTALLPAIRDAEALSASTVDVIFGVYAIGLLPSLLVGGRLSDRLGRLPVACAGAAAALLGTLVTLLWIQPFALLAARLVVGLGVGLAISSGTAWAADLKGRGGAATAGGVLSVGFALGPFVSGIIASSGKPGIRWCFAVAAVALAVPLLAIIGRFRGVDPAGRSVNLVAPAAADPVPRSATRALTWAVPLAPWVFASVCLAAVTIPTRVHAAVAAPFFAGTATLLAQGAGAVVQLIARRQAWGPQAGIAGAVIAAAGYAMTAAAPPAMSLWLAVPLMLVLGCGFGLCLQQGLIDVQTLAPHAESGAITGIFYAVGYLGFGLPLLLTVAGSGLGSSLILGLMAAMATLAAVVRWARLPNYSAASAMSDA